MTPDEPQKFRTGSVPYLNAVPLTRGIESDITFATPAKLAEMLQRDELDAALVSITEVLLNDRYDILDGIAIASLGEVYSVILAHRKPLAEALPFDSLALVIVGGLVYSAGVAFFLWESLKFQTAIWHAFVAVAAACQFVAVFFAIGR